MFEFIFISFISEKFHKNIQNNNYSRPKGNNLTFSIDHYAGTVCEELQIKPNFSFLLVLNCLFFIPAPTTIFLAGSAD